MTIIGEIELKKMSVADAFLTPKTITFNQTGWDKFIQEAEGYVISETGYISKPSQFTRYHMIVGLVVHFDMKQEEDFLIGVF